MDSLRPFIKTQIMKSTNTLYEQQRAAFMRDDQYEDYVYKKLKENEWEEFAFLNENI